VSEVAADWILAAAWLESGELGDVTRFAGAPQLCSWAGSPIATTSPTPPSGAGTSPSKAGHWCAGLPPRPSPANAARRTSWLTSIASPNVAAVAAARKLLTLVYYGLRDGHIRCLAERPAEAA
jgi:hypothetical protein